MEVRLISVTKPFFKSEMYHSDHVLSPEELIVHIARVSNPANQDNHETAPNLIRYLIKNKHWSPMEMVDMTVKIVTSRAIAQQILRHRSFSFQEFSQRYAQVTEFEPVQLRKQAEKNRQSSTEAFNPLISNDFDGRLKSSTRIKEHLIDSNRLYKELIEAGVAKECARMVLPLTTQTTLYMKGSVRSWIHYLQIRCDEHTQLEHREIANEIRVLFAELFPVIHEALNF